MRHAKSRFIESRSEDSDLLRLLDESAPVRLETAPTGGCEYLTKEGGGELFQLYNNVMGKLVTMENNPDQWLLQPNRSQ